MKKRGPKKISWKKMDHDILAVTDNLQAHGFSEPTVRAVYYVLGSLGKIPLTDQGYKELDAKVVQMRKDGIIPWGFFAVKRGRSYQATPYWDPKEWADASVKQLKDASKDFRLPRWHRQKEYVEVWIEKDGLLGALRSWLSDLDVTVRAPQGYGAWEFIKVSIDDIKRVLSERPEVERVTVFYLGDLDPSGKDIPRFIEEDAIDHFGLAAKVDFRFIELALSQEQVAEYHLPEMPDSPEVLEKIRRDSRYKGYIAKYGGEVFCELDAFFSLQTDIARALIRNSVEGLFDPAVFSVIETDELPAARKRVARLVRKSVKFKRQKKKRKQKKGKQRKKGDQSTKRRLKR